MNKLNQSCFPESPSFCEHSLQHPFLPKLVNPNFERMMDKNIKQYRNFVVPHVMAAGIMLVVYLLDAASVVITHCAAAFIALTELELMFTCM